MRDAKGVLILDAHNNGRLEVEFLVGPVGMAHRQQAADHIRLKVLDLVSFINAAYGSDSSVGSDG